jgi:tRNA 2-thiouridine synthesizing protein A
MIRVDARGMRCPWPAIRTARALRDHKGEEIEIWADDPAAARELALLAEGAGVRLETFQTPNSDGYRLIP